MANTPPGDGRKQADAASNRNSKWRPLLYKTQERTKQNKGIHCVFRAFTASLNKKDITVVELPLEETTVPIEPGLELASSVLDIASEKGQLKYPFPARLTMPTLVESHHFYTAVAKMRVDDSSDWTTVPAKKTNISCCLRDLRECELPPFTRIRVAIFRAVLKESKVIRPDQVETIRSSVEPKISIDFPKNAFKEPNEITISVRKVDGKRIETLKHFISGCDNVIAASDMMHVEKMNDLEKSVKYNMPAVDTSKKGGKGITPEMHTWLVQQLLNKNWKACEQAMTERNKKGVVSVKSREPVTGMVMMKMATNSAKDAEFAAEKLNQHLDEHVVRFIQKQKKDDETDILTDCVRTEDSDHTVSDMCKRGFTEGQEPSHEILVREGQAITMILSERGNIRRLDYGNNREEGAVDFVFHSKYKSCRRQFSVEPNIDPGQTPRDFYFGCNEYYAQLDEREPQKMHEFEIRIPKPNVSDVPERTRRQRVRGVSFSVDIFRQIAQGVNDWTRLASELQMDEVQIAKIQHYSSGESSEQVVYSMLYEWFMTTRVQNKFEWLSDALRRIHQEELADLVPYNKLMQAFFFVRDEASGILRNWKTMGRYLEVRDNDIDAIDIDETRVKNKVFNVLTTWRAQAKGAATVDKLIKVMRKMNMHNTADRLIEREARSAGDD